MDHLCELASLSPITGATRYTQCRPRPWVWRAWSAAMITVGSWGGSVLRQWEHGQTPSHLYFLERQRLQAWMARGRRGGFGLLVLAALVSCGEGSMIGNYVGNGGAVGESCGTSFLRRSQ